jgi:hypothetical protein
MEVVCKAIRGMRFTETLSLGERTEDNGSGDQIIWADIPQRLVEHSLARHKTQTAEPGTDDIC